MAAMRATISPRAMRWRRRRCGWAGRTGWSTGFGRTLIFAGTLGYGQVKGWLERRKLIAVANAAPDHVAVVA
jgi:hypothetical protein